MSVTWYGEEWEKRLRVGAMQGVVEGIGIVEKRAVYLITHGPKTGRIYHRRGVSHQASAPGEAPASDTGTLVNARRIDLHDKDLSARLIFTSKHAPAMEHGTLHIRPRPFARRSLEETRDLVLDAIHRNVAAALGR